MRKISFAILLFGLLIGNTLQAQVIVPVTSGVPQKFPYSSQVRDANLNPMVNRFINLRFSMRSGTATGPAVYIETDTTTTSPTGIFTVVIGGGSVVQGRFDSIPWQTGTIFMQIEVDLSGGTNFTDMGTTQILSFPYAITAGNGLSTVGYDSTGSVIIKTTDLKTATSVSSSWLTSGNATGGVEGFIGTTDNTDVVLKRMNAEGLRLRAGNTVTITGKLGLGVNAPVTTLDVNGGVTLRDTTVNVTAPFTLSVGNHGLIFINSFAPVSTTIATLRDGLAKGQIVILAVTAGSSANGVRFLNNGGTNNTRINTDGGGVNSYNGGNYLNCTDGNTLTLLWNGTDWVQIAATISKN